MSLNLEIWGLLLHLQFVQKYDFQNAALNTLVFFFQPTAYMWSLWQFTQTLLLPVLTFIFKKNEWNLTMLSIRKWKIANMLEMGNREVKRAEIWDSGTTVEHNGYLWPDGVQGHFASFIALVSNLISSNIGTKFTSVISTAAVKQSAKAHGPLVYVFFQRLFQFYEWMWYHVLRGCSAYEGQIGDKPPF